MRASWLAEPARKIMPDRSQIETSGCRRLLTIRLEGQTGILIARRRARELASLFGFDHQDQTRIATATSEVSRNALDHGQDGGVAFLIDLNAEVPLFIVQVKDNGQGIHQRHAVRPGSELSQDEMSLGLTGTRRLMDRFSHESNSGHGNTVTFAKALPASASELDMAKITRLCSQLTSEQSTSGNDEVRQQDLDLLDALQQVRRLEAELDRRQADVARLNQELEETNQGVVALYLELDERASALRRADDVKTRFLSYMSHEFRTPLNSILALSELLLRRVDGDLEPEQEKQIGFMKAASNELLEMVNDLLDIAKVEAGKIDIRLGSVDLAKLFAGLRGMMRPLSHGKSSLIFEDAPIGLHIFSDEGKISQVLRNLISNALKFTEQGEVRVWVECASGEASFFVSDTGIGIALEDQDRIFHEFSQIENPVQRKVRGTGLGLPLSRKLAELLGGTLTVQSKLGMGSTFRLSLPLTTTEPAPNPMSYPSALTADDTLAESPEVDASNIGSILIIDDDEIARYLARQYFRGTPYVITEASSGIEGLERARFDQPTLILLDINMPDRNGFDVLEDLKADPATGHIPVVVHTSRHLTADDLSRLNQHHAAILPKNMGDLERAIRMLRELLGEPQLLTQSSETAQ